jgi:hypothetical protein
VLVSHDRRLLSDVATNVLDLDPSSGGRPRRYGDGYAGYVAGRKAELARWTQQYDRYLVERQRLADDLSAAQNRLQSGWRPPKSTGKHQRATRASSVVRAVHRRIDGLAAHEVTEPNPPLRFQLPDLPSLPGVTLLRAEEVAVEGRVCTPASVALRSGERLLVTGPNGAGTSRSWRSWPASSPPTAAPPRSPPPLASASWPRSRARAIGAAPAPSTTRDSASSGPTAWAVTSCPSARSDCSRTPISHAPLLSSRWGSNAASTSPSRWPRVPRPALGRAHQPPLHRPR